MKQYLDNFKTYPMIVRLSLDGDVIWAHGITGGNLDECSGLDLENTNNTMSVSFSNDKHMIFLRVDSETGNQQQST